MYLSMTLSVPDPKADGPRERNLAACILWTGSSDETALAAMNTVIHGCIRTFLCKKFGMQEADADAIAQSLFIDLWLRHKHGKIRTQGDIYYFLQEQMERRGRAFVQRARSRMRSIEELPSADRIPSPASDASPLREDVAGRIRDLLDSLSADERVIVVRSVMHGIPFMDIADDLGKKPSEVRRMCEHSLLLLRQQMQSDPLILSQIQAGQ